MKTFVVKIFALLVLLLGIGMLGRELEIPSLVQTMDHVQNFTREFLVDSTLGAIFGGAALVVLGFYMLLPSLENFGVVRLTFVSSNGTVTVNLRSVQRALNRVMAEMPEVKRIHVSVRPDKEKKKAIITADAVLNCSDERHAHAVADMLIAYMAKTARQILGVSDIATITLNVEDFFLDPKALRQWLRESQAFEQQTAVAGSTGSETPSTEGESSLVPLANAALPSLAAASAALNLAQDADIKPSVEHPESSRQESVAMWTKGDEQADQTKHAEDNLLPPMGAVTSTSAIGQDLQTSAIADLDDTTTEEHEPISGTTADLSLLEKDSTDIPEAEPIVSHETTDSSFDLPPLRDILDEPHSEPHDNESVPEDRKDKDEGREDSGDSWRF
jgi:hypothetical protein